MEIHLVLLQDGVELDFHGTKSDLIRNGGRITVHSKGKIITDLFLKDLDDGLYEDDKRQFKEFELSIKNKKS